MKVKPSKDAENDDGWKEIASLMTSLSSCTEIGTVLPNFRNKTTVVLTIFFLSWVVCFWQPKAC